MSQKHSIGPYKTGNGMISKNRIYGNGGVLIADFCTPVIFNGAEKYNAEFFARAASVHEHLIDALLNSNVELRTALEKTQSITDREMINLRLDSNARVISKARGDI